MASAMAGLGTVHHEEMDYRKKTIQQIQELHKKLDQNTDIRISEPIAMEVDAFMEQEEEEGEDEREETAWVRQRWERLYLRSLSVFSSPSNRLCRTREGRKKMAHSTRALSRRAQGSNV